MSDDTTRNLEIARSICSSCWYQNERVVYNVNGRCDVCSGTDFVDAGITSDQQVVILQEDEYPVDENELPGMWEGSDFTGGLETSVNSLGEVTHSVAPSYREIVKEQTERLRNKKHGYSPDKDIFFKD